MKKMIFTKKQTLILQHMIFKMKDINSYVDFNVHDLLKVLPVTSHGSMSYHIKNLYGEGAIEKKKVGQRNKYRVEPRIYRSYDSIKHTN